MDPLTALSTAGTFVQFVDFVLKVLTTGHQLYKSPTGSLSAYEELKCVARDLSRTSSREFEPSHGDLEVLQSTRQYDNSLEDLCRRCETAAQELMEHLGTLRTQGKKEPLKSFRSSFKATWDQEHLHVLVQKLQSLSKSIGAWFLVDIE
jgi:hypothetical protein